MGVSIVLTVLELVPDVSSFSFLQISAVLRLFRLVFTFRKANEFRRIQKRLRKQLQSQDYSIDMAFERILELLHSFLLEPWVKTNAVLVAEIEWCLDAVSSNKMYEAVLTIRRESQSVKQQDLINLVKIFSVTPKPETHPAVYRKRASSMHSDQPFKDLNSDVSNSVLACLNQLDTGLFDVFRLKEVTEDNELVTVMHTLFTRGDLFVTGQVNSTYFANFVRAIQAGYHADNPYHNATHAADVVQFINFMLVGCEVEEYLALSPVEVAGCFLAAAVHDYDHPGLNNGYLVSTQAELALRYNDRSVLESHHVASAFALTLQEDKDLFVEQGKEDYRHMRELMIEMVLATDIAQHFTILSKFRAKFVDSPSEMKMEDRTLALSLLLHAADISNPSRPWAVCQRWTKLVMEEFWTQGDRERSLGLPITFMMDRYAVNVAKSQVGFIDMIVAPVFSAFKEILPKFEAPCQSLQSNKATWSRKVDNPSELPLDPSPASDARD